MTDHTLNTDVRLRRPDRSQVKMLTECDDDLIGPNHPARLIWDLSGKLDLSAFHTPIKARQGVGGRDATDPQLLFCLWLLASQRGVGSARQLASLCTESKPFLWLCGGVTVNYHLLADFRVAHGAALDDLFTQLLAMLVEKGLVKVYRIAQDGTRVRACAGAGSFRGAERLERLLQQSKAHIQELKTLLDDPEKSAGLSARRKAAKRRAAKERAERIEAAMKQLPAIQARREKALEKAGEGSHEQQIKSRRVCASTSDAEARKMKMGNGGFNPAFNVQLAVDTESRAIVGVAVSNEGTDSANLSRPMREQVERRTGGKVKEHLMDGGYTVLKDVDQAAEDEVDLYMPPKPPRNRDKRPDAFTPRESDSAAVAAWRRRMGTDQAKHIYKKRASTVEPVNGDVKEHRGLRRLLVRGIEKATSVALWSALAYNVMHCGAHLA